MKQLKDSAVRAREILKREQSPLPRECEVVLLADLTRLLSGYFSLLGEVRFTLEKGGHYRMSIEAEAAQIKPFGVIRY